MSDAKIIALTVLFLIALSVVNPLFGYAILGLIVATLIIRSVRAIGTWINKNYLVTSYVKVDTRKRRVQRTVRVCGVPLVFRFRV